MTPTERLDLTTLLHRHITEATDADLRALGRAAGLTVPPERADHRHSEDAGRPYGLAAIQKRNMT